MYNMPYTQNLIEKAVLRRQAPCLDPELIMIIASNFYLEKITRNGMVRKDGLVPRDTVKTFNTIFAAKMACKEIGTRIEKLVVNDLENMNKDIILK